MVTIEEIKSSGLEVGSPIEILLDVGTEFIAGHEDGDPKGFISGNGSFGERRIIGYIQRFESERVFLSQSTPHNGKDLRLEAFYVDANTMSEYTSLSNKKGY